MRDLIRPITKHLDDYYENCMKIKFNLADVLPINKTVEILSMIIVARAVSHENDKYYPEAFLDECQYKL